MIAHAQKPLDQKFSKQGLELVSRAFNAFRPPPDLSVAEWAVQRRHMSDMSGGGRFNFDAVPFMREIVEVTIQPKTINGIRLWKVVNMKSAQVGYTDSCLNNMLGAIMDVKPTSCIVMFPREKSYKDFRREKFVPMIEATPSLSRKIDTRSRVSDNTQGFTKFPGGFIKFVGSNSTGDVKSTSARIAAIEEPDDCNLNVKGQGDAIRLLEERTKTFPDRFVLVGGTPTIKGISSIEDEMKLSDKRYFYVPCHHCESANPLAWENIHWKKTEQSHHEIYGHHLPATAVYHCPDCAKPWTNTEKNNNVKRAEDAGHGWKATAPFNGVAGFYLNEIYSTFANSRLEVLVERYIKAKYEAKNGDIGELIAFYNSCLGLPWEMENGAPDIAALAARAKPYGLMTAPAGSCIITAGVDVQHDRLAVVIICWGRGEEAWVTNWLELNGNVLEQPVWDDLTELLATPIIHVTGAKLHIQAVSIDSSDGGTSDAVYGYVRANRHKGFMAIKGSNTPSAEIYSAPKRSIDVNARSKASRYGLRPYMVGVSKAKSLLMRQLKLTGNGPGVIHTPQELRDDFYEQITSEVLVPVSRTRSEWRVKTGVRNEALDCVNYARHAARHLRINTWTDAQWTQAESRLRQLDLLADAGELPNKKASGTVLPPKTSQKKASGSGFNKVSSFSGL